MEQPESDKIKISLTNEAVQHFGISLRCTKLAYKSRTNYCRKSCSAGHVAKTYSQRPKRKIREVNPWTHDDPWKTNSTPNGGTVTNLEKSCMWESWKFWICKILKTLTSADVLNSKTVLWSAPFLGSMVGAWFGPRGCTARGSRRRALTAVYICL